MKKLYCVICGKYRKFEKPKTSYLLEKTLVLSIICSKCNNEDENFFKEEESIEISKILGFIENIKLLKKYGWTKYKTRNLTEKYWWKRKLFNWINKSKWIDE